MSKPDVGWLEGFIESHDNCWCQGLTEDGQKLIVESIVVRPDGTEAKETEWIDPTLQAVRDWLGY